MKSIISKFKFLVALALVAVSLTFTACDNNEPAPVNESAFLINLQNLDGNGYFSHFTSDISTGVLSATNGFENEFAAYDVLKFGDQWYVIGRNGDFKTITKITFENGSIVAGDAIPVANLGAGNYRLLSNGKLLGFSEDYFTTGKIPYSITNLETFTVEKTGTLDIPILPNSLIWPNSVIEKEGKLYVTYIHCDDVNYANYDLAYVSIFDATTFAYEKTITDTRTAALGYNRTADHIFTSNGDLYIASGNSDYWGINENLPAGVLKIKAGQSDFDPDYFFDISALTGGNHFVGMQPVGGSKAIVRVFKKELIESYADFSGKHVGEHYLVDVVARTAQKLDWGLAIKPFLPIKDIGNGTFAIPVNTESENSIYIYNSTTGEFTKGLTYQGGTIWDIINTEE
jgi:hypothetical protein